jgi:hypothetical protein
MLHGWSRSVIKGLAFLAAALLLSTQLAMAAAGCTLSSGAPAQAGAEAGCGDMPMDQGVCLACCVAGDQAAATPDQPFHLLAASASIGAATSAIPDDRAFAPQGRAVDVPRGPPLRILFCSYQT